MLQYDLDLSDIFQIKQLPASGNNAVESKETNLKQYPVHERAIMSAGYLNDAATELNIFELFKPY